MPAAKKKSTAPSGSLALYEKVVAALPNVERKGASHPYTSLNGHMFSYLHPSGFVALRLPAEEREKFLKTHRTKLVEAYGIVQKEYVTVPDALLRDTKKLSRYFALSLEYVQTLKPKPGKKKA